ncbi:hypothetical protein ACNO5E_24925 [Vibrio parahaemolyticus]|uniref:hypothetical protein n=1 Tax=Vibrio parahaemolyticus TaxID=670 RepID=UPI001301884D|nr:hypothetical protein [Vibrio parahaemolyticus]
MLNQEVYNSLVNDEFGDARSYLDEIDPKGMTDIALLNEANSGAEWHFDSDGWWYTEI